MAAGKTAKGAGLDCACTHKGVAAPHRWNVGGCLLIWTERSSGFLKCFTLVRTLPAVWGRPILEMI